MRYSPMYFQKQLLDQATQINHPFGFALAALYTAAF